MNPALFPALLGLLVGGTAAALARTVSAAAPLPALYLIGVNAAVFALAGYDKSIAPTTAVRVPERVLLLGAALGGSLGLVCATVLFRHKTAKQVFLLKLAVIIAAQAVLWLIVQTTGLIGALF